MDSIVRIAEDVQREREELARLRTEVTLARAARDRAIEVRRTAEEIADQRRREVDSLRAQLDAVGRVIGVSVLAPQDLDNNMARIQACLAQAPREVRDLAADDLVTAVSVLVDFANRLMQP